MTKQTIVEESLSSIENGTDPNEKQSIWASILRDVKSSTKTAPATKSLVVLGDNESGRTTLVAKLQGNDDPKRGAGLEYHYIDVKDDDRDDTPKLGVWILDGDVACSAPLLKFAMKPEALENTLLILVATMTYPWSLLSTLKKWTTLIEEHIDRLQIDPIRLRDMRDRLQYEFQHYIEPNDTSVMITSSASSTTLKSGVGGSRVPTSISSVSLTSTNTSSPTLNGDEQVVLPLPDGVLTKSLGIPVIVVITKCDIMSTLEKENDYKDEYFDFMQHHLRRFCLEYGAALFYTSVKEKKNIDKLYKYIVYKCYGYPFTSTAAIVERDAIFIPAGWDNPKKVDILLENLHRLKSTDNYSDVFIKPVVRRPLQRDNEIITAEDDQEFLSKLQLTLNRASSPGRPDENATPVHTRASGGSSSSGAGAQTPSVAGRSRNQSNTTPGGTAAAANEGALANFFNSLLTRKSGGAVTPTGGSTPAAQRQTSQSPTTPSSKRLQQHPLTFAVTPPPGRTRTPTSHKPFPSSLNAESPPRLLSPVVEQQTKVETTTSASPTIVRTPLEENETMRKIEDPAPRNHHEQQSDDVLQTEHASVTNANQQSKELINSQRDSMSSNAHNSDEKIARSSSRLSPVTVTESNNAQIIPNDISLSQSLIADTPEKTIDHSSSAIRSRSVSPSQHNELSHSENENSVLSTNPSSPSGNANHHLLGRSISKEHKTPRLSSSSNFDNSEQLNDNDDSDHQTSFTESQGEGLKASIDDTLSSNNNEEPQIDLVQSLNSSRRKSLVNSPVQSPSVSRISNELQQQKDPALFSKQLERQSSSSDLRKSETPIRSRSPSPMTPDTSELSSTNQEQSGKTSIRRKVPDASLSTLKVDDDQNRLHSPVEKSDDNLADHPADDISSSSINENHDLLESSNSAHRPSSPGNHQHPNSLQTEDNRQKSPIDERLPSPLSISENLETIEVHDSPTFETGDIKFDSHETSTSLPTAVENSRRSRSLSPANIQKQERSRSPSPANIQKQERSRSPSPANIQKQERSRSPSPIAQQEQQISRSSSIITDQNQQRSRSPSPAIKTEQQNSRSSSPVVQHEQQRSRSPSPNIEQELNRSASPITGQSQKRSRSSSLITDQNQQRSRSPSPTIKEEQQKSRPASPIIQRDQQRSRSPSPISQQNQQPNRSPSSVNEEMHEPNRSLSPVAEDKKPRSRSPSIAMDQNQQRSRSPSSTIEQELNRSASPITGQSQKRSRSSSLITDQNQQRSRSPSRTIKEEQQKSRPASPIIQRDQQRSRSPSPINMQKQEQSRSPSPIAQYEQQRSRSPSIPMDQSQRRSRSPSPINMQKEERSRSPSPIAQQEQRRGRSPSPNTEQEKQRSRSPSPSITENRQKSRSPSFNLERNQERSRSPSLNMEHASERSPVLMSSTIGEHTAQRSRSPSPTFHRNQQLSRSPSLVNEQLHEQSRSSSPVAENEKQRSRSSSFIDENEQKDLLSFEPLENNLVSVGNESSLSKISSDHETEAQSTNAAIPSSMMHDQQQQKRVTPGSPINEYQRRDSSSQKDNDISNSPLSLSPKLTENNTFLSSTNVNHKSIHDVDENALPAQAVKHEQQVRSRSPSLTMAEGTRENDQTLSSNDKHLQKSALTTPVIDKHLEEPLRIPSPVHRDEPSLSETKKKTSAVDQEQSNLSNSSKSSEKSAPNSSTQRSSVDRRHESTSSSVTNPSIDRPLSITRSQSQSTLARPNTLHFSPNNHNLDGLYMSNDYNDEDELVEDNEYHHNSAPSTVSVEYRRSSLLHDPNLEQRHTPIDPNDILKRLSIVEKSRLEDNNDISGVDSTNSKDT